MLLNFRGIYILYQEKGNKILKKKYFINNFGDTNKPNTQHNFTLLNPCNFLITPPCL